MIDPSNSQQDDIFLLKHEDSNLDSSSTTNYQDKQIITELAGSGSIGVAAAAAILSSKHHSRHNHHFETNPAIRKRQQTRLLRKLNELADEYGARCGQQICIICCTPSNKSKQQTVFKVFGTQPLESVVNLQRTTILTELDNHLKSTIIDENKDDSVRLEFVEQTSAPTRFDLPPLTIDGIPTSLEKMTQCQLRMFIPLLLKYSTGRQKPGWNRIECKPVWWPAELPWANVRVDPRDEESKKKNPWTEVLKQVIRNCYKYHGREDLLNKFLNDQNNKNGKKSSLKTTMAVSETMATIVNNNQEEEEEEDDDENQNTYAILQQVRSLDGIIQVESTTNQQQQRLDFNMNEYHHHHHNLSWNYQPNNNILTSNDMIINDEDEDEERSNNNIIELEAINKHDSCLVDSTATTIAQTTAATSSCVDYNDLQMIKHKRFRLGLMKNINNDNK